jgi:predicted TIM-barrel fold metal-dependent hydrolase
MLSFFDAEIGVGGTAFDLPVAREPADLLALMDRYRIDDALVHDRAAHEAGVFDRFDFLLNFCAASPRLHPAIPILPPACGEQPPPDELVEIIRSRGIRAVRACPAAHNYHFDPFTLGPLLERLAAHRIPVLHTSQRLQDHPWNHESDTERLRSVAQAFPELPLVLLYAGMLEGRRILPLLDGCPNVLVDLTGVSFSFIEYVTHRFGPERLVYASHHPTADPGLCTTQVLYSGVPAAARALVAGGNIRRLVEGLR